MNFGKHCTAELGAELLNCWWKIRHWTITLLNFKITLLFQTCVKEIQRTGLIVDILTLTNDRVILVVAAMLTPWSMHLRAFTKRVHMRSSFSFCYIVFIIFAFKSTKKFTILIEVEYHWQVMRGALCRLPIDEYAA